jgi:hypothetical protein
MFTLLTNTILIDGRLLAWGAASGRLAFGAAA